MCFMPEDYKLTRRDFIRSTAFGLVGLVLGGSALASDDQWKKIKKVIPAGEYDVLCYVYPGGGKEQKFLYLLDIKGGPKAEIYTVGVEKLGTKSLDDVLSDIEKEKPYLKPDEVHVAPIKKGGEVFGYAIYYSPVAHPPPYTESVGKGKYTLFPKSESESGGGGGAGGAGGAGGSGGD